MEELFEIYDESGQCLGTAPRSVCHGNPRLLHRTAHVVVFSTTGRVLLQKRSRHKDIQPGKWDTAVGGHLMPGENYEQAARREMQEELGLPPDLPLRFLFYSKIRNSVESEDVGVFAADSDGPFTYPPEEIDEVRFWSAAELRAGFGTGQFTPHLEQELGLLISQGLIQK